MLTIIVHETGHIVGFINKKTKIKAVMMLCLLIFKKDNHFYTRVHLGLLRLVGGFVVPEIKEINEDNYEDYRKVFAHSIKLGPIFSTIFVSLMLVLLLVSMIVFPGSAFTGVMFYSNIMSFVMYLIVLKSFNVQYQQIYGDAVSAKKIITDDDFYFATILSYYGLSEDESSDAFMFDRIVKRLLDAKKSSYTKDFIIYYLFAVLFDGQEENKDIKINLSVNQFGFHEIEEVYLHTLYAYKNNRSEYLSLYNFLNSINVNNKNLYYFRALLKYNIGEEENSEYLLDKNSFDFSAFFPFYYFVDFFSDYRKMVKRITPNPILVDEEKVNEA